MDLKKYEEELTDVYFGRKSDFSIGKAKFVRSGVLFNGTMKEFGQSRYNKIVVRVEKGVLYVDFVVKGKENQPLIFVGIPLEQINTE